MLEQIPPSFLVELYHNNGYIIQGLANTFSVMSFIVGWSIFLIHRYSHKTVSLQNGKYRFKVKMRNFNSTDLTTIVSNMYFGGSTIPGELRQEIFQITGTTGKN